MSESYDYDYEFFFKIKGEMNCEIPDDLKEMLNNISKIIENNYGVSYYDRNIKHKHKNRNKSKKIINNENFNSDKWRLNKTVIKKEINCDLDKYKYEINSLLNKLSPKNFDVISKKILDYYNLDLNVEDINLLITSFIDSIFLKATMQPIYCPYYVKFLNLLDYKFKILNLITDKCENYKKVFEQSNKKKEMSDYDKFCQDNLDKVFKAGYSQFIGELFNNKMVDMEIIKDNIEFFISSLKKNQDNNELFENIIICVSKLIITTSKNLENYKFNLVYDTVNNIYVNYKGTPRLKFKLLDLCEYLAKF